MLPSAPRTPLGESKKESRFWKVSVTGTVGNLFLE